MNLIACTSCGVVLDKNVLRFPSITRDDDYQIIPGKAIWNGEDYVAYAACPVCSNPILEKE